MFKSIRISRCHLQLVWSRWKYLNLDVSRHKDLFKNLQNESLQTGLCSLFLDLESSFQSFRWVLISSLLCPACTGHREHLMTFFMFEIYYQTSWWLSYGINIFLQIPSTFYTVLIILLDDCNLWYQLWIVVPSSKDLEGLCHQWYTSQ